MRKIEYGFRNIVYATVEEETDSTITYATPKSFLNQGVGGISVNASPNGERVEFPADDIEWYGEEVNNGYDLSMSITKVSKDFLHDVMGYEVDVNGAIIENANAKAKKFALGFEVQGNDTPKRTWYHYCSASRGAEDNATKDRVIAPATRTLEIASRPRPTDQSVKVSLEKTDNESAYNSFFNQVYEKQTVTV